MNIIKLDATDSTNAYLKNAMLSEVLDDYTVVTARTQLKGRGQPGSTWQSETGKNLTFSLLKRFDGFPAREQFLLNMATSLAVVEALSTWQVPDITIKWPNDILSGNTKVCGILIENMVNSSQIQSSVIGIGLNVNQLVFRDLPNASSLKLLLGRTLPLDEVLTGILHRLHTWLQQIEGERIADLREPYEMRLFRKDKPSTFMSANGETFMGFIRGISETGKLMTELEDAHLREFDLKEIQLLY
jgi:BirA family biotin operon repressor/biotin-[acetyl-CoA-carboxylase] ligase